MSESLESRVAKLERKTGSLPWTMLVLVVGMMAGAFMQYRINASFSKQFRSINRIETSTELTNAK